MNDKTLAKARRKLWSYIVAKARHKFVYPFIYKSYWHYLFTKKRQTINNIGFYTSRPNPGAGIGHQLANWIAGYWFAKQFNLKFAHTPFSDKQWDDFLGFGENEIACDNLIRDGYKKVLLPLFDENNEKELNVIKNIMLSYKDRRIVFVAEQDQFYKKQFGVMEDIRKKFYSSDSRKGDHLIYSDNNYNIAVHVRRGDIKAGLKNKNPNFLMRWQDNNYFIKVLSNALSKFKQSKPAHIYIFSQGMEEEFEEFRKFENIHFCLEMNPLNSFLHMIYADLLITSKSSFSYKPALLSNGIKICPKDFWHCYPKTDDWILVNEDGILI